jgi:hypothetical protein
VIEEALRTIQRYVPAMLFWLSGAVPVGLFFWFFTDLRARRYYKTFAPELALREIKAKKLVIDNLQTRLRKAERERDRLRLQVKTVKAAVRIEE